MCVGVCCLSCWCPRGQRRTCESHDVWSNLFPQRSPDHGLSLCGSTPNMFCSHTSIHPCFLFLLFWVWAFGRGLLYLQLSFFILFVSWWSSSLILGITLRMIRTRAALPGPPVPLWVRHSSICFIYLQLACEVSLLSPSGLLVLWKHLPVASTNLLFHVWWQCCFKMLELEVKPLHEEVLPGKIL